VKLVRGGGVGENERCRSSSKGESSWVGEGVFVLDGVGDAGLAFKVQGEIYQIDELAFIVKLLTTLRMAGAW